jgi:hypothetical protein
MTETQRVSINELNLDRIRPRNNDPEETGSKIVVIGKPGSGKSVLIDALIYSKKHLLPIAKIISGTEDDNKFYSNRFPDLFIDSTFDVENVSRFIRRQKLAKDLLPNPWGLLICDDCMEDPRVFNDPVIQNLFKNGRHWKCLAIFGLQYCMDFPPNLRTCVDGTFIFREPNIKNRKKLYENFAGIIPEFGMFCALMNQITDDHTALYIDNRTTSNDYRDCVFYYKAPVIPKDFRFGSEDYKHFANERYDADYPKHV